MFPRFFGPFMGVASRPLLLPAQRTVTYNEIRAIKLQIHSSVCSHVQSLTRTDRRKDFSFIMTDFINYATHRFAPSWPKDSPSVKSVAATLIKIAKYAELIEAINKIDNSTQIEALMNDNQFAELLHEAGVELPSEPTWDNFATKICSPG